MENANRNLNRNNNAKLQYGMNESARRLETESRIEYMDEDDDDNESDDEDDGKRNDSLNDTTSRAAVWKTRPDVWSDDVRMNALFAPFRNRDLNPLHYDNKLKFWKECIVNYLTEKDICEFDLKELEDYFERKNLRPKCLETVLAELAREKRITQRDEFLKPNQSLIQTVFTKLIWTPLSWSTGYFYRSTLTSQTSSSSADTSFNQSISTSSPSKATNPASNKRYVLNDLVIRRSDNVLKTLQNRVVYTNVDTVIEHSELIDIFNHIPIGDLDLMIKYLETNRKILTFDSVDQKKLIKFIPANRTGIVERPSEIELAYVRLRDEERKLDSELNRLHAEVDNLNNTIRLYLKQANKSLAMKYLKKRKLVEKSLETKEGILTNVQTLLANIQQADTNKLTYDVYTEGLSALKEATKDLKVDKIDDTMYDIQDMIQANSEIEEALAKSPTTMNRFEDSELNDELNELLAQESSKPVDDSFKMDDLIRNLPDVTSTSTPTGRKPTKPKVSQLITQP